MKVFSRLIGVLALVCSVAAVAADAKGCKDHPLFTRMSGYSIQSCEKKFEQLLVKMDEDPDSPKNQKPEGDRTVLRYEFGESGTAPSFLQVLRNYQNAGKQKGAEVLVEHPRYTALKFVRPEGVLFAAIEVFNEGRIIELAILEQKAMAQEVTANLMWDGLQKDGFIALHINFDTNKAVIKPESMPLIKQISDLLKSKPDLKVSIEGHTDNQGNAAANKTLSLERAKAVSAAVVASGIPANRLSTAGWGQERPVADNRSEDGRAKNRRVELVKK